ncbi:MAG TPA: hypothetical protein VEI46_09450 [Thermodesulfovibrionales bacterium]|nr:hypothetical protein [Thermodesulfovibrionales bacterium]
MDTTHLMQKIKLNCSISDAHFWGYYSICGLLLRLRELYRNEHSLMPWEEIPRGDISDWIASTEAQWKSLEHEPLRPLEIWGRLYDPFEVDGLNDLLLGQGLVYGGGYGRFNKPTFFLARLLGIAERGDYRIYYAGRELCRDLSTSVAMLQGRCIFMRLDSLKILLWDKLQELHSRKFGGVLRGAFASYGIEDPSLSPKDLSAKIDSLAFHLSDLFILHELGEAFEDEYADEWLSILSHNQDRATEFYVRGIKDLLADTSEKGPLKWVTNSMDIPLLNFYMVFMDGIRKEIFPEMATAFQNFMEDREWSFIEHARMKGYEKARELRGHVLRLWREGKGDTLGPSIKKCLSNQ